MAKNYAARAGSTVLNEAGEYILNNLPEAQRQLFRTSIDHMEEAGVRNKQAIQYALEQASQGKTVSSDWVRQQAEAAYARGANFRAMHAQNAENARELARMQNLRGVNFLQRPAVQTALADLAYGGEVLGNLYRTARDNPVATGATATALVLSPFAGYKFGEMSDDMPSAEEQQRIKEYLEQNTPQIDEYRYGDKVYDAESMD